MVNFTHTWGTLLFPEKTVPLSRYDNPPFPVIERAIKLVREGHQPGRLNSYTGPSVALSGQLVQIWGETQGGARRLACPGLISAAPFGAKRRREGAMYQRLFTTHRPTTRCDHVGCANDWSSAGLETEHINLLREKLAANTPSQSGPAAVTDDTDEHTTVVVLRLHPYPKHTPPQSVIGITVSIIAIRHTKTIGGLGRRRGITSDVRETSRPPVAGPRSVFRGKFRSA